MMATSSTAEGYRTAWDPSKPGARFYGAYFAVLGVLLPFLGPFLASRGVAAVGIGLITAAVSLAKLFWAPLVAARVDRKGLVPGTLTAHLVLSVAATLAVLLVRSPWALGAAFLLAGAGYGVVLPLVEAAIMERIPPFSYGRLRLWGSAGFVLAAAVASAAVNRLGIQVFPWLLGGWMAVLVLVVLPFEHHGAPAHPAEGGGRLSAGVWGLLILLTLHQVLHGPYYAFFSIHLESAGLGPGWVGGLWSLGVLAELATFFVGGSLERRWGLRRLLGAAILLGALRWAVLSLPPTLPVLLAAQIGHAASFALAHLAGIQLVQRTAHPSAVRRAQALYSGMTFGLGVVAGSALAGPLYAALGGRGSFALSGLAGVVLFLAWIPFSGRLPRARVRR